jgi:hypothetical protein
MLHWVNKIIKKEFIRYLILFLIPLIGSSQTQGTSYSSVGKGVATTFLTDYQCLGINPSALGWGTGYDGKHFTFGSSEFGFGISSDVLTKGKLSNFMQTIKNQIFGGNYTASDLESQKSSLVNYVNAGVALDMTYNWAGISYQSKVFGGLGFNIRETYQWYTKLSQNTSDVIFNGKFAAIFDSLRIANNGDTSIIQNTTITNPDSLNMIIGGFLKNPNSLNDLLRGSQIKMSWDRSYNFGYGRKIIGINNVIDLYAGIGARIIKSMAMFDLDGRSSKASLISAFAPSFNLSTINALQGKTINLSSTDFLPPAIGNGYSFDYAMSAIIGRKLKIALAFNNIGLITYDKNIYKLKDTLIHDVTISNLNDFTTTNTIDQLVKKGGIVTLEGTNKYTIATPANFRFGSSLHFKRLNIGIDIVAPLNSNQPGNIRNAVFSLGGDLKLFKWLQISLGYFGGGVYANNLPVGVTFIRKEGKFECGIASRDAVSFFSDRSHSLSIALGFARFRF